MVDVLGGIGDGDLDTLDATGELVATWSIILRDGRSRIAANVAAIVGREDHCGRGRNLACAHLLAVDVEGCGPAFAETATRVGELHPYLVIARRQGIACLDIEMLHAKQVVAVFQLAALHVEAPAAD